MMDTKDDYRIMMSLFRLGTNTIKRKCKECQFQSDKVICLGEEQAFFLELLINDSLRWDIQDGKICICEEEILQSSLRCGERPRELSALWNKEPEGAGESQSNEEAVQAERKVLESYLNLQGFRYWNVICEPIVLTLAINSCNKIVDRQTLIHLCMNSRYGAVLFRKVMMKTLSLLILNWWDDTKLEEIAKFYVEFLKELIEYGYRDDLEQNIEVFRRRLCDRIRNSEIDTLYREVRLQDRGNRIKWKKEGDILQYFSDMEQREKSYYVSRLALICYVFKKKAMKKEQKELNSLCRLGIGAKGRDCPKEMREVIDLIDTCSADKRKELARRVSEMIDACTTDWIDEEVHTIKEQLSENKMEK